MTITFTTEEPQPPRRITGKLAVVLHSATIRDATEADLAAAGYHRDDPTLDGTDGASQAWWRGVDHGVSEAAACLMAVAQVGPCGTIADAGLQAAADAIDALRSELAEVKAERDGLQAADEQWASGVAMLQGKLDAARAELERQGAVVEAARALGVASVLPSFDWRRSVERVRLYDALAALSSPTSPDGEQPAEPAGGALRAELDEAIATAGDLNLEVTRLRAKVARQRRELRRLNLNLEHYRRGYRASITTITYPVAGPGNWPPVVPETSPADEAIVDDMVHRATAGRAVTRMQPREQQAEPGGECAHEWRVGDMAQVLDFGARHGETFPVVQVSGKLVRLDLGAGASSWFGDHDIALAQSATPERGGANG